MGNFQNEEYPSYPSLPTSFLPDFAKNAGRKASKKKWSSLRSIPNYYYPPFNFQNFNFAQISDSWLTQTQNQRTKQSKKAAAPRSGAAAFLLYKTP